MSERLALGLAGLLACFGCGGENPMGASQTGGLGAPPAAPMAPAAPAKAGAGTGATAGTPVLYDARDRGKLPAGVEREPKLAPEVEKLVLSSLSPGYKVRREDCQGAEDVLFHVTASATGAFTAPGAKQAVYVVASGPCDATFPEAIEASHLVVVDGDKVVLLASGKTKLAPGESPPFYGTEIRAVTDVDQDGASELLVTSRAAAGAEEVGRLYALTGGAIKRLRAFTAVYRDGCAGGAQGKVQAQVIHYVPRAKEGTSQYSAELYEAACPASGAPKPTDFQPSKAAAAPVAPPPPSSAPAPSAQPSP